jgi:hypothetical protein
MSDEPAEPEYELVMPFVTVASKGGPHDDASFVAGWQLGALEADLNTLKRYSAEFTAWFLPELLPQVDLIAMKHGYQVVQGEHVDETRTWICKTLRPVLA